MSQEVTHFRMKVSYVAAKTILAVYLASISIAIGVCSAEETPRIATSDQFVASMRDHPDLWTCVPINLNLTLEPDFYEQGLHSYLQVSSLFQVHLEELKNHFPEVPWSFAGVFVLHPYFGKRETGDMIAAANPYMLAYSPAFDAPGARYERCQISGALTESQKPIVGLKMITRLPPTLYIRKVKVIMELLGIDDISARLFGFTHGQLLLPLSLGVKPSSIFWYNGPREWNTHKRYRANDQIQAPLALTNYAHSSKNRYLISDHPDFAVELTDYLNQETLLTFFFWRETTGIGSDSFHGSPNPRAPDFVFQISVNKVDIEAIKRELAEAKRRKKEKAGAVQP